MKAPTKETNSQTIRTKTTQRQSNRERERVAVDCHRLARVAIHSVPLVPRNTALLFSLRYLRSGLSSSNLKFARFLHCACSVSTPGSLAPICDNRPRLGVVDCHRLARVAIRSVSKKCLGSTLSMRNEENARTSKCQNLGWTANIATRTALYSAVLEERNGLRLRADL